jgi:L,D-transpeptidase ErfK/SrfK
MTMRTFHFIHKKSWILATLAGLLLLFTPCAQANHQVRYGELLCSDRQYFCITISRGETWKKLFPDPSQRNLVQHLNRINISLRPGMTLAIPHKLDQLHFMDLTPFAKNIAAPNEKILIFDPDILAFAAYNPKGELVYWGAASGGKSWCPDTQKPCPTQAGEFYIHHTRGADCISKQFPLDKTKPRAKIPYCLFFNGGVGFHGSETLPGFNDSHGCVRIFPEDSKWIYTEFMSSPRERMKVIVRENTIDP